MNGIELVSQKKFLTNISHTWNITCKPKKFLTNGVTCKPKKFSQKFITHGTQQKKFLTNGTELVSQKNFSHKYFLHMEHNL